MRRPEREKADKRKQIQGMETHGSFGAAVRFHALK